jgi:hypothetical protein
MSDLHLMAFQSMIDNGMKKKQRQNKALIEISATIMLQDYLNRKTFSMSGKKITTNILLKWFISQNLYFFWKYIVSLHFKKMSYARYYSFKY